MTDIKNNNINEQKPRKKKWLYWQFAILIIVVIVIAIFADIWRSNQRLERIEFQGNKLISTDELSRGLEKVLGDSSRGSYNLETIQKKVEEHQYVEKATAMYKDANVIKIEVEERIPSAIVVDEKGDLSYTYDSGRLLPYRIFPTINDLPIINGISSFGKLDSLHFRNCLKILEKLKNDNLLILNKLLSEILYDSFDDNYKLVLCDSGIQIIIGRLSDLDEKLSKLKIFLIDNITENPLINLYRGEQSKIQTIINYIDLRWKNQVVVK